jgi:hypothetical protein
MKAKCAVKLFQFSMGTRGMLAEVSAVVTGKPYGDKTAIEKFNLFVT